MCSIFGHINLSNIIRSSRKNVYLKYYKPLLIINSSCYQQRQFSIQNSVESLLHSQAGIFKSLSESSLVGYSQNFLVNFHDVSGLPWWGTIIGTTVLLRTAITLPLAVYQYYILAKLESIKCEMPAIVKELKKEIAIAIRLYNWDEKTAKRTFNRSIKKQWTKLIERENCHPLKTTILLIVQIPMWISLSVALRNLVYILPVQSLDAQMTFVELTLGGFGFIPNLTVNDSSYIFPVAFGLINLALIELQCLSRVEPPSRLSKIITNIFRGFCVLMVPIATTVPSCLVLYWTTSSAYGLVQNLLLLSPKIRRLCNIPKTSKELERPYEHVAQEFIKKYKFNIFH